MKILKITISFPANRFLFSIHGNGMDIEYKMIISIHEFENLNGEEESIIINES
jgi:hypothetical protein